MHGRIARIVSIFLSVEDGDIDSIGDVLAEQVVADVELLAETLAAHPDYRVRRVIQRLLATARLVQQMRHQTVALGIVPEATEK